MTLTRQVALLSLLPIVLLGVILAFVLQRQVVSRSLADATDSARIIAQAAVQPRITRTDLANGLTAKEIGALDRQLGVPSVAEHLARIKIWNSSHEIIYSEDHSLIGRVLTPSDDLEDALEGTPQGAERVNPSEDSETASEVGLGELVEVYVPLRLAGHGRPDGAFEMYLSYGPIAAAVAHDKRTIAMLVAIGLFLLWAILYRIVARASSKLDRQARENHRLARFDVLTGLPNRTLFAERAAMLERDAPGGAPPALLLFDLERFTEVNTTLGSVAGDEILREVGRRLQRELGPDALAARVGGDEFAVLCPQIAGVDGARELAGTIQASVEKTIVIDGVALNVEATIGFAVMGEHAADAATLMRRAELALAHARALGSRIEGYSQACERVDAGGLKLLGEVRGALDRDEFTLHFQPKVDLQAKRITGVEALIRWRHPEHGELAPVRFIPLIEQTALIAPVTKHVFELALAQAVAWRRRGIRLEMSVNVSARNLLDADLAASIGELLARHDVPAEMLIVEVTESAAMVDPDRCVRALHALRELGVGISVDDFGTGNASIEYLAALPATELKIDRSFVTGMLEDERAAAIVRSTIDLARNLGLAVVAEGIETEAVMDHLTELGCATGQGYFISRPMAAEALTETLAAAFGLGGAELRSCSGAVFAPSAAARA
jgi:diguanylate cyclase (GGDEF)-like protein